MNNSLLQSTVLTACLALPLASHALSAPGTDVASFLGTSLEDMEAINPTGASSGAGEPSEVTRGTAMRRTLTVSAGDVLRFDWFFGTDEGPNGANNDIIDFAFFSVGGSLSLLASALDPSEVPADGSPFTDQLLPLTEGGTDYFRTLSVTFNADGEVLIGFAVVDVSDTIVESGLIVDNVTLNGNLLGNGGFEDNLVDGNTVLFDGWETLGDVGLWENQPPTTEGNVGALLMSGNFAPDPVPVPAAVWLFGSAIGALAWRRRRG